MSDKTTKRPAADWYPHPDTGELRYWDGTQWTDMKLPVRGEKYERTSRGGLRGSWERWKQQSTRKKVLIVGGVVMGVLLVLLFNHIAFAPDKTSPAYQTGYNDGMTFEEHGDPKSSCETTERGLRKYRTQDIAQQGNMLAGCRDGWNDANEAS